MNTCGINQEIRKILNLVEESEMNPSQWLNESFGFVEIDHVEDPLEEANSLGNMTNWVEDKDRKLVRPTTAFERRNMLMTGWRDALKVERGEGKDYEQAEIDYRFFEGEFQSKGWKKGWTSYCIAKGKGERKYVKPNELQKFLDAGWHLYDRIEIHKKEQGKKGDKYLNTWIDKSWFPEYQKEGWEMGWDNTEEWKKSFAIQTNNSKLGTANKKKGTFGVGNLSLTPVKSCPDGVPCARDGCYALQCYNQYPQAHQAWDHNYGLMKDPHGPEWLKRDMDNFFSKEGKNIKKFRWHVAGDLISEEHLDAIIAIAEKHGDIQFWLYTKNYNLVSGKTPPKNLVIILSAWNDFMIDEIERLHKKFPVAYLDDWDHKDVINKNTGKPLIPPDSEAYICPCADDSPEEEEKIKQAKKSGSKEYLDDRHCETCKTHSERHGKTDTHPCYMLQPGESLIFRKH